MDIFTLWGVVSEGVGSCTDAFAKFCYNCELELIFEQNECICNLIYDFLIQPRVTVENVKDGFEYACNNCSWIPADVLKLFLKAKEINEHSPELIGKHLLEAITHKNHSVRDILLKAKQIDLDYSDAANGRTALIYATNTNDINLVKRLLCFTCIDINLADKNGRNPLIYACYHGRQEIVQLLLKEKDRIDVNKRDEIGGTPLTLAARKNHQHIIEMLINFNQDGKYTVDLDHLDWEGNCALINAANRGNLKIVKALLNSPNYVDVNMPNDKLLTPLMMAIRQRKIEVIKLLLEHEDIDVNCIDKNGKSVMGHAVNAIRHTNVPFNLILNHSGLLETTRVEYSSGDWQGIDRLTKKEKEKPDGRQSIESVFGGIFEAPNFTPTNFTEQNVTSSQESRDRAAMQSIFSGESSRSRLDDLF